MKCYPCWLVSYSVIWNKRTYFNFLLFQSHLSGLFGVFYNLNPLPVLCPCFLILNLAMPVTYLVWTLDTVQTSQGTSVYPLHNLKECSCWSHSGSSSWVRRVRMCLWGSHWRRGDSSFSQSLSASQHCRKSLHTLGCPTAHSHTPARTSRQTNRQDRMLHALIKELAGCNLALYN